MTLQPTIDRESVLDLFHKIMRSDTPYRVLRLLGEAKMGKSHLLTKVFPAVAHQRYNAEYVVVDLRSNATAPDILHRICIQLGGASRFPTYFTAYTDWLHRPAIEVNGLQSLLSKISVKGQDNDSRHAERLLLTKFLADLTNSASAPLLLMFDAVEQSDATIQNWLMHDLLAGLAQLSHVRVIVAGRELPDAAGGYAAVCSAFQLKPVQDEAAYITFCQELNLNLAEQSIRDIAKVTDYKPGFFADMVLPKFSRTGAFYG